MKMFRLNVLFAVLMAFVVMSGCKKDEDSAGDGYVAPATAGKTQIVEVPTAIQSSSDQNLQMVNMYAQMVNGFSGLTASLAAIPSNATVSDLKSTGKVWTWSNQGLTVWIEFIEDGLGYNWKMYFQGGEYLTKTLVIEATQDLLGLSGTMKIYSPDQVAAVVTYTWEKVGTTVNATLLFSSADGNVYFVLTGDENGSGSLKVYYGVNTSATKIIDVTWDSTGHGTWWVKDPDTSATASGTF